MDRHAAVAELFPGVDVAADHLVVTDHDLDDVVVLLRDVVGDRTLLDDLPPLGAVHLDRLELRRVAGRTDLRVDLSFEGAEWTPFDGLTLHLDRLRVRHGRDLVVLVDGSAEIDGLVLHATVELPALVVSLRLTPDADGAGGAAGDHVTFLEACGLTPPGGHRGTTAPRLERLAVDAAPRTSAAVVHAAVTGLVDAAPFHLDRVEAEAVYVGGMGGVTTGWVQGEATLEVTDGVGGTDTIAIALRAELEPDGWRFDGTADLPDALTVGRLAAALGGDGLLPPVVADCAVVAVEVAFDTVDRAVEVACELSWPHEGADLHLELTHRPGHTTASGTLAVGDVVFDLRFVADEGATLVGAVTVAGGHRLDLATVVAALAPDDDGLAALAGALHVDLRSALVGYRGTDRVVVAADVDLGFDLGALSTLPLVGSLLPPTDDLGVSLRPVASTGEHPWPDTDLAAVRDAAPSGAPTLPDALTRPLELAATLDLGGASREVGLVLDAAGTAPPAPADPPTPAATTTPPDDVTWIEVGRALGPLHVERVGLAVDTDTQHVRLLVAGALSVAGLTLGVDGLGLGYRLDTGAIDVTLRGLGIAIDAGPIAVAGAFANLDGDFAGKVLVRTETFGLTALGAAAMLDGVPSVFLYGVLDYPLGGPPFFFVEGLALGFGVHRHLTPPALADLRSHPLVADAVAAADGTSPATTDPTAQLARLHDTVRPALGEYFGAVGIKFTSFKLIESFVLVVVRIGAHVELDLIGAATYRNPPVVPPGVPAMALVELDLLGRVAPDEGVVAVQARLDPRSYVYSPLCHLSGGFAFSTWFAGRHEGDFVLTVGGYHPDFHKPAHYPTVERLKLRFQVSDALAVTGSGYFALTPSAFMAGAAVDATFDPGGGLHASFHAGIDLLIGWEPYHYDARLGLGIAASWGPFSTEAHASLHLWGPDFSGLAEVSWTVFSFDVAFGAGSPALAPVDWARVESSFLPAPDAVTTTRVASGVSRSVTGPGGTEHPVVTPADLALSITTLVPVTATTCNGHDVATDQVEAVGIAPMAVTSIRSSVLDVTIERRAVDRDGTAEWVAVGVDADASTEEPDLAIAVRTRAYPRAVWGPDFRPPLDGGPVTAPGEVVVTPHRAVLRSEADEFQRSDVDYDVAVRGASGPASRATWLPESPLGVQRPDAAGTDAQRRAVLGALGAPLATVAAPPDAGFRDVPHRFRLATGAVA